MKYHMPALPHQQSVRRKSLFLLSLLLAVACSGLLIPARARAACASPASDYGTVTSTVNIDTAGTYRIWSRIMAPDATANSYFLEVDGNACYVVGDAGIAPGVWTWLDYQNGSQATKIEQQFTAGSHSFKLIGREAGVKLDRLLLVSDLNCVPEGTGDNCAIAGDLEPPTVTVTAPAANTTVSNTVDIKATATDNTVVAKVEFYINGMLVQSDTTAPYAYSWATTTAANGAATLMVKAYDAAGNASTQTVPVTVSNGDSQAPSQPAGVTAEANAYNKVTVTWSASTDNMGVAGYWVSRNGTVVAKVTTGTQYVDPTVLPSTSYSYRVAAIDNAGNTSALSAEAKVTTPAMPDSQAPSAPVNLQAQAISSSQINLTWSASTDNIGVAAYEVYRAHKGQAARVATVTGLSFGDTGLAADRSYSYYVVAKDQAGNTSPQSATASATTQSKPRPSKKTGVLQGKVRLAKNKQATPTVTVVTWGYKRIVSADSQGNYALHDLPAGTYAAVYQAPGYRRQVILIKVKADKVHTKNVTLQRR